MRNSLHAKYIVCALTICLAGCPMPPPEDGARLTLMPPNAVLDAGKTIELHVTSTSADDTEFDFSSSNPDVAAVEAVKSAVVVLRAFAPGTTTITATALHSGASATSFISVPAGDSDVPVIPPATSPGLDVEVISVTIPGDRRPLVRFTATDAAGKNIAISELTQARFTLAYLNNHPVSPHYVNYSLNQAQQATYDSGQLGDVSQNADGSFNFKFRTVLPESYDMHATHQVGGQFQRRFAGDNVAYKANALLMFRPDGQPVSQTREITSTETCNACHTRLSLHGDIRREIQLCILCHTPQSVDQDTGNTVDMPVLIHKIHRGKHLPSVLAGEPYRLIGHNNRVFDYSTVSFPQDIRNCSACHKGAPHADNYLTKPSRAACGSCHDRTWFGNPHQTPAGFTNHPFDFEQTDDAACATCHKPTAPAVSPILDRHGIEIDRGPGLELLLYAVTADPADEGRATVTVHFTAADGAGNPIHDLTAYNAQAGVLLAWPAPEYEYGGTENFVGSGPASPRLANHGGGEYSYELGVTVAADSTTYAVAMQGRVTFSLNGQTYRQGLTTNGVTFFTVDGSEPVGRRMVIDEAGCNSCHGEIRFHGNQRVGADVCLMCHHPSRTDLAQRNNSTEWRQQSDTVTVNFKDMIHRIHTGNNLNRPYTVVGFGGTPHDFTKVRFPGDRRACAICHIEGTYELPLGAEVLSTLIDNNAAVTEILPERAACNSCHDHLFSDVHAVLMSDRTQGIETCAVCHGAGQYRDVREVHRMGP